MTMPIEQVAINLAVAAPVSIFAARLRAEF
jgi:hypothetical protein